MLTQIVEVETRPEGRDTWAFYGIVKAYEAQVPLLVGILVC